MVYISIYTYYYGIYHVTIIIYNSVLFIYIYICKYIEYLGKL